MTQSNKSSEVTYTFDTMDGGTSTITLDTGIDFTDTFTISSDDTITLNITDYGGSGGIVGLDNIWPSEVERMCKQYPGLEKVWRNFKSVYDMVKQDYEGKKKAGEIDDDIPF